MSDQKDRRREDRDTGRKETDASRAKRLMQRMRHRRTAAWGVAAGTLGGVAAAASGGAQPAKAPEGAIAFRGPDSTGFRISSDWDITPADNEQVNFFKEFLQWKNKDKTKLWLERLGRYGPMIQEKLAERDMPQDLLWLATIESGLDPNAYSKADAAGIWQFIAETGRRYGLEISEYVDERRDPVKSTDAALDYLKQLNERMGGSWYLAAAGYNTGENRIERIVNQRAGGDFSDDTFWKIEKFLPSETRDYVPVMLAMGTIAKDPAKYGFGDLNLQEPYAYKEMRVPAGTRLDDVAKQIGVDPEVLYDLNPHLVKKMTPPDRDWDVRIPVDTDTAGAAAKRTA